MKLLTLIFACISTLTFSNDSNSKNLNNIDCSSSYCQTIYVSKIVDFEYLQGNWEWLNNTKQDLSYSKITMCSNNYAEMQISSYKLTGQASTDGESITFNLEYEDGDGLSISVLGVLVGDSICVISYTSERRYSATIYNSDFESKSVKRYVAKVKLRY